MEKRFRKTKLKTMLRKQRLEKRITKEWKREYFIKEDERKHKVIQVEEVIPVIKSFNYEKRTQDWNPNYVLGMKQQEYYISKIIQNFCEYLKDLFCIDHKILLDIRCKRNNRTGTCYYKISDDNYQRIMVGAKEGLRATVLVHEFLHVAGYGHEYEINGYSDYLSNCNLDQYSPLIVKDIFGKKEVLLT